MQTDLVHNRPRTASVYMNSQEPTASSFEETSTVQNNGIPQVQILPTSVPTLSLPIPDPDVLTFTNTSILSKALQGVNLLMNAQKTLYIVEHPNRSIINPQFEMTRKTNWNRYERYCVYVTNSMLSEHFDPYHQMHHDEKRLVIKNVSTKILFLNKCYQSAMFFPDPSDNRVVTHFGYYNSHETNEYYFGSEITHNREECFKMHNIYLSEIRAFTNKLVKYDFRDVDLAALSYMVFAQECDKHDLYIDSIEKNKNQLFNEYLKNVLSTYGHEKAGQKYANILNLQMDINELQQHLYEFRIMGKVFFSNDFVDLWDELLAENQSSNPISVVSMPTSSELIKID